MMDENLLAAIAHDMKNSLAILEGKLESMSRNNPEAETLAAYSQCAHLRQKLVGFLTLYKGEMKTRIDAVSPEDFLLETREAIVSPPDSPAIEVIIAPDAPVIWFFDERLVQLALEAAIQNAMRFAGSSIALKAGSDEGQLVFSVLDDGPGLGAAEKTPSTGLGTQLCQTIARAHVRDGKTGSVTLMNSPAGGALFELRLP